MMFPQSRGYSVWIYNSPLYPPQDIDDCKFPEFLWKGWYRCLKPIRTEGEREIVGTNVFQVVGNAVASAQHKEYLRNETQ